jgi:hypothetical protein
VFLFVGLHQANKLDRTLKIKMIDNWQVYYYIITIFRNLRLRDLTDQNINQNNNFDILFNWKLNLKESVRGRGSI